MLKRKHDDNEEDESHSQSQGLFVSQAKNASVKPTSSSRTSKTPAAKIRTPAASSRGAKAAPKQSQLSFWSQVNGSSGHAKAAGDRAAAPRKLQEPSEDEISDDDAFEPPSTAARRGRR